MDDRSSLLMNLLLNEEKHIKRFLNKPTGFTAQQQQRPIKTNNQKQLLKGQFYCFSTSNNQFKQFQFELYPNILIKVNDRNSNMPNEYLCCQFFNIQEENQILSEHTAYGIVLENQNFIVKIVTDKFQTFKIWMKFLKRYCILQQFLQRYKVENRIYEHFYRCVDKKKKIYTAVKIVNKKGLKPEQQQFVDNEIMIIRKLSCPILPPLKKIYEDQNYVYMTFQYFKGDDLMNIANNSKLEEIAIATLAYHILKGLKLLHSHSYFHGNLKLENIIFSTSKKDNEIFLINFKFTEEINDPIQREKMIKKGNNYYIAPEVLENKRFDLSIDIFSLGVCLFYMVFKRYPYVAIEKDKFSNIYLYKMDLSQLENMKREKKRDPNSKLILSASGIDFFMNLLAVNPSQRPTAVQAMNHPWFINFTSKQGKNKRKNHNLMADQEMMSLRTIIESSEISEREISQRHLRLYKPPGHIQQQNHIIHEECQSDQSDELEAEDESNGLNQLMQKLNQECMQPSYESKKDSVSQQNIQQNDNGDKSEAQFSQYSHKGKKNSLDENQLQEIAKNTNLLMQSQEPSWFENKLVQDEEEEKIDD